MSNEAPQTKIPEQYNPTSEEIAAAFIEAQQTIYKLTADPEFHEVCMSQAIDPYDDMDKPNYWYALAQHVSGQVNKERGQTGNSLQLSTLELLSEAPIYAFEQEALNQKSHTGREDRQLGRQIVSFFNSTVRVFATEFPEVRASNMETALLNVVNMAVEDKDFKQGAAYQIHQTVRGAQHELAFGQILAHSGRQFTPASLEEDLRGIDFTVQTAENQPLYVDVKASLDQIERNDSTSVFAIKSNDTVIMYSMTRDSEFRDKFFTPDTVATGKVEALNHFLNLAAEQIAAA